LVAWKAGNLRGYEPFVDVTSLTIGTEYDTQITLPGVPVIVMVPMKPIAINYATFTNSIATNAVNTAWIQSWSYEEIARIDPAQRNSDPPHAYILMVNTSFQQLFSSLTLCIRLSQSLLTPMQQ